MIRIKTVFGAYSTNQKETYRVYTLLHGGKWVTLCSGRQTTDANSLLEAGQNHLQAATALLKSLQETANLNKKDVHTEHCCVEHGCKYSDVTCTVTTGKAPASHPCEWCYEDVKMKRIPEQFELDEDDLVEAVTYWLNHTQFDEDDDGNDFDITFKVEQVQIPPPASAIRGGMTDPIIKNVFSATAKKE